MEIREGTLQGFSSASYEATVQITGSLGVWLGGVPVARNIPAAEMVSGRRCAVLFFDAHNPRSAVVIAVYS